MIEKCGGKDLRNNLESRLSSNNVLFLGAPSTGKTNDLLETFGNQENVLFICERGSLIIERKKNAVNKIKAGVIPADELAEKLGKKEFSILNYNFIIIDDFFKVLSNLEKSGLDEILRRKQGMCLSTTPYRGEYIKNDPGLMRFINACERVFYTIEHDDAGRKIGEFISKKIENKEQRKELLQNIGKIVEQSRYEYNLEGNKTLLGLRVAQESYVTYVPYWLEDFLESGESGFKILTKEFMENLADQSIANSLQNLANYLVQDNEFKNIVPAVTGATGISLITSGAAVLGSGGTAGVFLATYIVLKKIRDWKKGKVEQLKPFAVLLKMKPQDIETLEKKLGVPPLTLFTAREFLKPKNWANLFERSEELNSRMESLETKYASHVQKLDYLEDLWATNEAKLGEIKEFSEIFKNLLEKSLKNIDVINQDIANFLEREGIKGLRFVGRDEDLKNLRNKIKRGTLLVIEGHWGIGKSTLAYELGKSLEKENYRMLVPDFGGTGAEWIEKELEKLRKEQWTGIGLISEYERPASKAQSIEGVRRGNVSQLKKYVSSGRCDFAIITCRTEYMSKLENDLKELEFKYETFHLEGLKNIREIVEQVVKVNDSTLEDIERISEGNPLVAILTARYVKEKGREGLKDKGKYDIIWERIETTIFSDKISAYSESAVRYIAASRAIKDDDLAEIVKLPDVTKINDEIGGYFNTEIKNIGILTFYPDIFNDVIFAKKCLPNLDIYINKFIKYKTYYCLEGIAHNLSNAYQSGISCETPVNAFAEKIKDIGESSYVACLSNLLFGGVPIDPNLDMAKLKNGAEAVAVRATEERSKRGDRKIIEPVMVTYNFLARLAVNHILSGRDKSALEKIELSVNKTAAEQKNPEHFLLNFYSIIVSMISGMKNPDSAADWIKEIEAKAKRTAAEQEYPEHFLAKFYSMIVSNISEMKNPESAVDWIKEIDAKAKNTAAEQEYPDHFLMNFYSMIVFMISEMKNPDSAADWIKEIDAKAKNTAAEQKDPGKLLMNFYSMIVSKISNKKNPESASDWIKEIEVKAKKTAAEQKDPEGFLENFYSMIVFMISDKKNLESAADWIKEIDAKAKKTAAEQKNPGKFLMNFYSMIVFMISDKKNLESAADWIKEIDAKAKKTSAEQKNPDEFLWNFYSMIISKTSEMKSPGSAADWYTAVKNIVTSTGGKVVPYFYTALMLQLNGRTAQHLSSGSGGTLERSYLWHVMLLGDGILASAAPTKRGDIISRFVLNSAFLIIHFSKQKQEELDRLFKAMESIKEKDAEMSDRMTLGFYPSCVFLVSKFTKPGDERKALLLYVLEKTRTALGTKALDWCISSTLLDAAQDELEDFELGELLFSACSDPQRVLETALAAIGDIPQDEVCRVLQNIGRLLPQELAEDGWIAAVMERAKKEKGC